MLRMSVFTFIIISSAVKLCMCKNNIFYMNFLISHNVEFLLWLHQTVIFRKTCLHEKLASHVDAAGQDSCRCCWGRSGAEWYTRLLTTTWLVSKWSGFVGSCISLIKCSIKDPRIFYYYSHQLNFYCPSVIFLEWSIVPSS